MKTQGDEYASHEIIQIRNQKEANNMRQVLRSPYAVNFNMSILKMALNVKEDAIAGCLAAKYAVKVEMQMVEFAIINKMIDFLKHVFMNNKQPELTLTPGQLAATTKGNHIEGDESRSKETMRNSQQFTLRNSQN